MPTDAPMDLRSRLLAAYAIMDALRDELADLGRLDFPGLHGCTAETIAEAVSIGAQSYAARGTLTAPGKVYDVARLQLGAHSVCLFGRERDPVTDEEREIISRGK